MAVKRPLIIVLGVTREIGPGDTLYMEADDGSPENVLELFRDSSTIFALSNWGCIQSAGLATGWRSYYDNKTVIVGTDGGPTRIGSWDNQNIELYPNGTGVVSVRGNGVNVPAGKSYNVDGVPHSHAGGISTAKQTAQVTNSSNTTPTSITGLSFSLMSGHRYRFKFFVTFRSAATTTGVGFVFTAPAMTAANWKVSIRQAAAGTDQTYEDSTTALTTTLVSASVIAAATDYIAIIEGFCEPSASGTLQLHCRSEVNASTITIQNTGVGSLIDAG